MSEKQSGITIFIIMTFLFMMFLSLTLFLLLFDFNNGALPKALINIIGKTVDSNTFFKCFATITSIATCNYFGFLAFRSEQKLFCVIIFGLIYFAMLGLILYFGWTLQIKYFFNGDTESWSNAFAGIIWVMATVLAVISVAGTVLIKLLEWHDFVYIIFYILIPVLFPIVFVIICWIIVEAISGKIKLGGNWGSSSSSSDRKTYTYTNSMGCESTVVSDNGKDFYDPCSGAYEGTSNDGGQTINTN